MVKHNCAIFTVLKQQETFKTKIMETTIILTAVFFGTLITFNYDLENVYNRISKVLFGGKGNMCKY